MTHGNSIVVFLVILTLVGASSAYTYLVPDPGTDGQCKDNDGNLRKVGESWYIDKPCEEATCIKTASELFHSVRGCGIQQAPEECELVRNSTAKYPLCCPQIEC